MCYLSNIRKHCERSGGLRLGQVAAPHRHKVDGDQRLVIIHLLLMQQGKQFCNTCLQQSVVEREDALRTFQRMVGEAAAPTWLVLYISERKGITKWVLTLGLGMLDMANRYARRSWPTMWCLRCGWRI